MSSDATGRPTGDGELPSADETTLGASVVDREADTADPNTATVINLPPVTCGEWEIHGDSTVAEDNPEYDPDSEVVVVAFDDELADREPEFDGDEPLTLAETSVRFYAFPPARLALVGDEDEADSAEPEPDEQTSDAPEEPDPLEGYPDMRALRERLGENADVDVLRDRGEPALSIVKLGAEHIIRADGSVSEGPLSNRLAGVVDEYLGGEGE